MRYSSVIEILDWSVFKFVCITTKQLLLEYTEDRDKYDVYGFDSGVWHVILPKGTADATDFENNYKTTANTKSYRPVRLVDVAGTALSGQKAMAGSIPVAIGTEQSHSEGQSISGAQGFGLLGSTGSIFKWLKLDENGNLVVAAAPTANVFFIVGEITSSTTTTKAVEKTTYTKQTTNGQRSIASASANDTGAGTGARTVRITYLDQTGAGPYTETLTLTGTTGVNTIATNICFIEKMEVLTVGSTGSNVGIITLYSALNKGGVAIGSIAATDNITFWCHHYVPTGLKMKVSGISVSHNGTTVGSGAAFFLRAKPIGVTNVPDIQISDFVRLYGQSSTFSRLYNSPINVTGPARVLMFTTPESASSFVYRASVDFYEE